MTITYNVPLGGDAPTNLSSSVLRYGINLNGATGKLVGTVIATFTPYLRKNTTATGTAVATVRDSADSIKATSVETLDVSTLSATTHAPITFTFATPPTLASGDNILVEFTPVGSSTINIDVYASDQFDTSLTRRTRWNGTAYSTSNTADISAKITDGTFISQTFTHKYKIRQLINQTFIHKYKIRKLVSQIFTHVYHILVSSTTPVNQTFTHIYNVRQLVTQTYTHKYNIRQLVNQSYTHKYNIRKLITQYFTHIYNIIENLITVNQTFIYQYKIRQQVSQTYTHKYKISQLVSQIFTYKYNIKKLISQTYTHRYKILEQLFTISQTYTHKYNIVGRISRTYTHIYKIFGYVIPLLKPEGKGRQNLRAFNPDIEIDRVPEPERALEEPKATSEIRRKSIIPDDPDLF